MQEGTAVQMDRIDDPEVYYIVLIMSPCQTAHSGPKGKPEETGADFMH